MEVIFFVGADAMAGATRTVSARHEEMNHSAVVATVASAAPAAESAAASAASAADSILQRTLPPEILLLE